MTFSGALTLTDLNDYITPAQACIKPVEQLNPSQPQQLGAASTEIRIDANGSYYEVSADTAKEQQKLQPAEVSLNDCLACSGCITSAESVLITLQSHTEVLSFLETNPSLSSPGHKVPVLSIAPQALASLSASLAHSSPSSSTTPPSVPLAEVLARVQAFATSVLGFDHVYDTTLARHLALLEHAREFEERRAAPPRPSDPTKEKDGEGEGRLPMLASACPGWVCYAEKTHGEMLPFISRTKSPQQIMGTLVKEWLGPKWDRRPDEIYHVTVMPCYDKKLEASRPDFYNETHATRDVDCVLTTGELALMMREKGWDLSIPAPPSSTPSDVPTLLHHPGSSSGSYLQSLLHHLTATSSTPLTLSIGATPKAAAARANVDNTEYTLTGPDGVVIFRGATCYGFRNLQNVVRRVGRAAGVRVGRGAAGRLGTARKTKTEERPYDYVEVMACPGGCVNGGGQLPRPLEANPETPVPTGANTDGDGGMGAKWGDRAWTKEVERAYWDGKPEKGGAMGLLTPPDSPRGSSIDLQAKEEQKTAHEDGQEANIIAARVLMELCAPSIS
ncbi:iron hydrogenase, partial [Amylostereum chailletii]